MLKILILAMLMLLPMLTIAQTQNKIIYVIDNYHNRTCVGGNGFCSGSEITGSTERTTASIISLEKNKIQVTLDKAGFTAKEWEEIATSKNFSVDDNTIKMNVSLAKKLNLISKTNIIKPNKYNVSIESDKAIFILELIQR